MITDKERRRLLTKALVVELLIFILTALALFVPDGTVLWYPAWAFLIIFFSFVALLSAYLSRYDPQLLAERITLFKPDQFLWDKVWLSGFYLLTLAWLVLMPLDVRLRLSHWGMARIPSQDSHLDC